MTADLLRLLGIDVQLNLVLLDLGLDLLDTKLRPIFQVHLLNLQLDVGREFGLLAHVVKLNNEDFSRDPEVVHAMNDYPLIAHEVQPTRTAAEMARADDRLKREFPLIALPILILHGTLDRVTRPSGSQLFYDTAGSADKTLKLYEGHYHDLLHDVGKEQVLTDITSWIDARVSTV